MTNSTQQTVYHREYTGNSSYAAHGGYCTILFTVAYRIRPAVVHSRDGLQDTLYSKQYGGFPPKGDLVVTSSAQKLSPPKSCPPPWETPGFAGIGTKSSNLRHFPGAPSTPPVIHLFDREICSNLTGILSPLAVSPPLMVNGKWHSSPWA